MPKSYPVEFGLRIVLLVRAGESITDPALELGISEASLYTWVNQDRIYYGQRPGLTFKEHSELVAAKGRIRELGTKLTLIRRASELFKERDARIKSVCESCVRRTRKLTTGVVAPFHEHL